MTLFQWVKRTKKPSKRWLAGKRIGGEAPSRLGNPVFLFSSAKLGTAAIVLAVLATASQPWAAEEEPWTAESLYAPRLSDTTIRGGDGPSLLVLENFVDLKMVPAVPQPSVDPAQAAINVSLWAKQPSTGPLGRPLPVAMHMLKDEPSYVPGLVRAGHHVMPFLQNPAFRAHWDTVLVPKNAPRLDALWEEDWRPRLDEARKLNLPIMIFGMNWAQDVVDHEARRISHGKEVIPTERRAAINIVGDRIYNRTADPLGPIDVWKAYGRFWTGNEIMKRMQEVYPDPPLVLFGDNAEAGELHDLERFAKSERFLAAHGPGPHTTAFLAKTLQEGYRERYTAMFEEAKNTLTAPAWKKNTRFVAYNTLWGHSNVGNDGPKADFDYDPQVGWQRWLSYEGSIPELYDNDWQPGKRDNVPFSMQVEAGGYYAMQERIFSERPDFWWAAFVWDGAVTSEVFRGTRGTSKPFWYASRGKRWSFPRYEGWVQFSLWATRPRLVIEFRAGEPLDAMRKGTWEALLRIVDRPWNHPVLGEFWRKGSLVANTAERPWFDRIPDDAPQWMKDLNRWYILTSDANPRRETWSDDTVINVFAQALVLGEAPSRRWLVFAHAPTGPLNNVGVTIPDFGNIRLPSVSLSGSFYLISEADKTLSTILNGGSDTLSIAATPPGSSTEQAARWTKANDPITFTPGVSLTPGQILKDIRWNFGDGRTETLKSLESVSHSFSKAGTYLVGAEVTTEQGASLRDEIVVHIGDLPPESVVYDLPLDNEIDWEGPWAGVGENGQTLATYRHVPNRSATTPEALVAGGQFVEDPERGRVFELVDDHGGIYLIRSKETVLGGNEGAPNRTISFWFKANDVNTRQVLYASGLSEVGVNIYLDGGMLYAGSWASGDGVKGSANPIRGYNWKGNWISTPVEAGRWYQVTWVLKDGTDKVQPDRQSLYLDGKLVGSAPGAAIPNEYVPPRVGRTNLASGDATVLSLTRFHDQERIDALKGPERKKADIILTFRGRIDDFKLLNAAVPPL